LVPGTKFDLSGVMAMKTQNVVGLQKALFVTRVRLQVFLHFLPELLRGQISFKKFYVFLERLLYFFAKMDHNKFVRIDGKTRIDLYCPGFPSAAFYTACKKFMTFGVKLPCTTVLLSITSACRFNCQHCYQKHDIGQDVDIEILVKTVKLLQDQGIAFFNIEGGEPFLTYPRLKRVCEVIDGRSEIWINSTGDGIDLERLRELKKLNVTAIMFSMHSPEPSVLNVFMGSDNAWGTMEKAIDLCHQAGMAVAFNCCLQKEGFYNGQFEQVMERARQFGASLIQFIKPKPAGGWLESGVDVMNAEDLEHITRLVNEYNQQSRYQDYPVISAQIIEEGREVFGCTAGGTDRFYINAKGDLQPCEFLNISFGNIAHDHFDDNYQKMRDCFAIPGECWICEKYSGDVLALFKEHQMTSLPLPPEISCQIYDHWDRGAPTELYRRLEK